MNEPNAIFKQIDDLAANGYGIDDIMVKVNLPRNLKWRDYVKKVVFKKAKEGKAA